MTELEKIKSEIAKLQEKVEQLEKSQEQEKKSGRWKPEVGNNYFYIGDGRLWESQMCGSDGDYGRFLIGNCFRTKEEQQELPGYGHSH